MKTTLEELGVIIAQHEELLEAWLTGFAAGVEDERYSTEIDEDGDGYCLTWDWEPDRPVSFRGAELTPGGWPSEAAVWGLARDIAEEYSLAISESLDEYFRKAREDEQERQDREAEYRRLIGY